MPAKTDNARGGIFANSNREDFRLRFIGPDLKRYNGPRPFDSKMLAEGWLAREREMIMMPHTTGNDGFPRSNAATRAAVRGETVESYAKRWIENRNLAPRTRKLYADLLAKHIAPSLGEIGIGSLSSDDVNRWHSQDADRQTHGSRSRLLLAACHLRFRRRTGTTRQESVPDQTGDEHESQTRTGVAFRCRTESRCRRDATATIQGAGLVKCLGRITFR